jgi:hypothetical protein
VQRLSNSERYLNSATTIVMVAIVLLREGSLLEPKPGSVTAALAEVLGEIAQDEEAESLFRKVLASIRNDSALAWTAIVHGFCPFLKRRSRVEEAEAIVQRLVAELPDAEYLKEFWPVE